MSGTEAFTLLKSAAVKWSGHNAPRLGASLAFYTLLSMAPLVILVVSICGLVFNKAAAEANVLHEAQELVGYSGAMTLRTFIDNAHHAKSGIIASLVAIITLLFGASGVFMELRDSLNVIWGVRAGSSAGWRGMIWQRLISFGMVLALGFLLLVSLILSAALGVVENVFTGLIPLNAAILGEILNFLVSLLAISVLFGLIFKFVPDAPVAWRDVTIGAVSTALLFSIGRALLALYIGTAGVGSAYGAAGSLVALVVWVYYSAQIFFFGAVLTKVYADRCGSRSGIPSVPPQHSATSAR